MSYDHCPHPLLPLIDDRHIASHEDDIESGLFTNDRGETFYLQRIVKICQGCGTELTEPKRHTPGDGRWQSTTWLIPEDPV